MNKQLCKDRAKCKSTMRNTVLFLQFTLTQQIGQSTNA